MQRDPVTRSRSLPAPARVAILLLLAGAGLALSGRPAAAQQAEPLGKADVVRLLVDPTYSADEVTGIVRRSCLDFSPTPADMEDFRKLGAGEETLAAIRTCAASGVRGAGGGTAAAPVLKLQLSRDTVTARAGELAVFAATVDRAGRPAPDITLVVVGSGRLPGGAGSDVGAVTDSSGTALFRIPVGRVTGSYELRVRGADRRVAGPDSLTLRVRPAPAAVASVDPAVLRLRPGAADSARVRVTASDTFGNPVPSASVQLRLATTSSGEGWSGSTDEGGGASVAIPASALRVGDTLAVLVDGRRLAGLPVEMPARTAAAGPALTPDSAAALRGRADSLLQAGDPAGAESAYERILAARPDDPDALIGRGRALLAQGRAAEASRSFAAALEADPTRLGARRGLGMARLRSGDAGAAIDDLERVTAAEPSDAGAWTALGEACLAAGRGAEARRAFQRALAADPGRTEARVGLRRARDLAPPEPPYAEGSVWEGYTVLHRGGARDDWGPRRVDLHLRPSSAVELWGRYDDALNLDHPGLVRGEVDVRSWWAGAGATYGSTGRFRTRAEFGRRKLPPAYVIQTMWWLEQTVYLGKGGDPFLRPSVHASGLLGHWYDMDDWLVEAGVGIPLGRYVRLEPRASYGKLVGSVPSSQRVQARDARFGVGAWFRPAPGWRIEPVATYGHVEGPAGASDPLTGNLFDATLRLHVPIVRQAGVDLFGRYQSPPGRPSFAEVGMALWGAVPRS